MYTVRYILLYILIIANSAPYINEGKKTKKNNQLVVTTFSPVAVKKKVEECTNWMNISMCINGQAFSHVSGLSKVHLTVLEEQQEATTQCWGKLKRTITIPWRSQRTLQ